MKSILAFCLTALISFSMVAQPDMVDLKDPRLDGLDKELEEALSELSPVGFSVAVVEKDQVIYSKGFGFRDLEAKKPADANTLYAIGSSSKAFTSALLGQLEADEEVDLDESPITYLPSLRFHNASMNELITIRDLMCHRSGLPRHDLAWYFWPSTSQEELMAQIEYMEPTAPVRSIWQYNNFGFMIQGAIAAEKLDLTWGEAIDQYLFTPLGMERSNTSIEALEADDNASLAYKTNPEGKNTLMDYYHINAMGPAGAINSSVNEMSKWVQTWIYGGKFGEEEVIPAAYTQEAMSPQMVIAGGFPSTKHPDMFLRAYGFGWFLRSYRGHYQVEHGGNIDGFSANVALYPTDSLGIIVLANQNGSAIPGLVRNLVADRMLELEPAGWLEEIAEQMDQMREASEEIQEQQEEKEGVPMAHKLEDFVGEFMHPAYGSLEVIQSGDSLFIQVDDSRFHLKHKTYHAFSLESVEQVDEETARQLSFMVLNFQTDASGKVHELELPLEPSLNKPMTFKRQIVAQETEEGELDQYLGEYEIATVTATFYVDDEGTFFTEVPGQPPYALVKTATDEYAFRDLEGFSIVFLRNEEGKVRAAEFNQPNGVFQAKKK